MQRQSIILGKKKENSYFGTKKTTVAGPDFYITPTLRPRCQMCPKNGMFEQAPRPQSRHVEVPNMKNSKDIFKNVTKNKQDTLISQIWPSGIWSLRTLAM